MTRRAFAVVVEFVCPFCDRPAGVTRPHGVMHQEPQCLVFQSLDATDYLRAVNQRLGTRLGAQPVGGH